jgi:tetratricopeptide (TPR) repeat protein
MIDRFREAVNLAESGRLEEAKSAFEEILLDEPRNADVLYNLGMCFTELGQPDKAITVLTKSMEYNPKHSNSYVALGYAYTKTGDSESAKSYFLEALERDPHNPYAMRNLGSLLGKSGDIEKSLYYLEKAYKINPSDPNTVYGLAYCYQQLKDYQKADQYYRKVLKMDASSDLKELARTGLREIAMIHLKSKGLPIDAVMYMVSALKLFERESEGRVKEITFEIALKGRNGFDINNPDKKYTIHSLPGVFTGLQLVSYMYVGFKKIAPEQDIGIDLAKEYEMALQLFVHEGETI